MTTQTQTLTSIIRDLTASGYDYEPSGSLRSREDRRIAALTTCRCGCTGLNYQGFAHPGRASYRALAICPLCDSVLEF